MKRLIHVLLIVASSSASAVEQETIFTEWCNAETGFALSSLAANRLFGNASDLSESEYKARTQWLNAAHALAEKRFRSQTKLELDEVVPEQDWFNRCQLKDQVAL